MHVHPRSFSDRIFKVWRSPKRLMKNPDIVEVRRHDAGLFEPMADGVLTCAGCVFGDQAIPSEFHDADSPKRPTFGRIVAAGRSRLQSTRYRVQNPTLPDVVWEGDASHGTYPDQYQRDRLIQMHANDPESRPAPDRGASSWVLLDDGRSMLVDHANLGTDPGASRIVGLQVRPEKL